MILVTLNLVLLLNGPTTLTSTTLKDVLGDDQEDASTRHFGPASAVLTEEARRKVDAGLWSTSVTKTANFGGSSVVNLNVEDGPNSEGIQTLVIKCAPTS